MCDQNPPAFPFVCSNIIVVRRCAFDLYNEHYVNVHFIDVRYCDNVPYVTVLVFNMLT